MSATPPESSPVEAALAKVSRLATLPEITTRILAVLGNPDATAGHLEKLVSSDPVLSARVLKVVNSAFYGMPASVNSIKRAIVLLGVGGLRNIALAASLARLFGGMPPQNKFDPQGPWRHSTAVAAAAKLICNHIGGDGDEMFLAGLLHDVGTVVALQALRPQFIELVDRRIDLPEEAYAAAERACLGATHEEFGIALCRGWNFPETIQAAVEFHHLPSAAPENCRRAAQIICIADHLAAACDIGYCTIAKDSEFPTELCAELGLSDEQLADVRARMAKAAALAEQFAA